jgi:hypothetical protein
MIDWQIFALGVFACSIVVMAVRAISREDQESRDEANERVLARVDAEKSVKPPQ